MTPGVLIWFIYRKLTTVFRQMHHTF